MSRVRRGFKARRRRNKILKFAKGFHFDRRTKFRHAAHTVERALFNRYKGRRLLKRDIRKLWIIRINAAARANGLSYSRLINLLKLKNVTLNRKALSEIAFHDPAGFAQVVKTVQ